MKFFPSHSKDETSEERDYEAIKKRARESLGWAIKDRRICCIRYEHNGIDYYAEVGKISDHSGEEIIAILTSKVYLICTPYRGVIRGVPILVDKSSTDYVVDFE